MPDDLAHLPDAIRKELKMGDDLDDIPTPAPLRDEHVELPEARTIPKAESLEALARAWVKWLPVSILFCGLAFAAFAVVQIMAVARYHDALGKVEQRVKVLEEELIKAKAGEAVEYWSHQCDLQKR